MQEFKEMKDHKGLTVVVVPLREVWGKQDAITNTPLAPNREQKKLNVGSIRSPKGRSVSTKGERY
jgi:hypothetical protein